MRPGEHPLDELRAALSNQADDPLAAAIANIPEGERLVLVVDQFEEAFTTCASERERASFIEVLTHAASRWPERAVVILAIRGDYYAHCARYPELAEALAANHALVGPLTEEELRRAIELPARRAGLRVESALTDALVEEVGDEPGGLPLLSTALVELWRARGDGWVRMEALERTGGVRGAVARLADSSYEQLSDAQREAARRVFLRLVASGEGEAVTRRRISLEEFDLDRDAAAAGVLARLTQDRLLTMSQDTVEVAHEALLREWPRLQEWLREDAQGRELRHHLAQAARQWQARNRDRSELYRGARRSAALEWSATREQELNKLERDFLAASRHAGERAIRRLRAGIATLAVLLLVAVGAGVFAFHESTVSRRQALLATGRALTEASAANLAVDPERSILLALKAIDTFRSTSDPVPREAVEALHSAIEADRTLLAFHTPASNYVAFSPDGSLAATASGSSTEAVLWDAHSGRKILTFPKQKGGIGPDLRFSPDGSKLYTHVAGVGIVGWSTPTGRQVLLLGDAGPLSNLALSPDGKRIAATSFDGTLTIWSISSGQRLLTVSAPTPLCGTSFSPDGTRIAAALCFKGRGATALVWDTRHGRKVLTIGTPTGLGSFTFDVAYSPDGSEIATVGNDGKGRIWDARTGRLLSTLVGHQGWVFAVKFSPDGRTIATGSSDATARIWDAETGQQLLVLAGHSKTVYDVSFSPDGGRLLTGSTDGTSRIWDLRPQGSRDAVTIPAQGGFKGVLALGYSPDGRLLVTGGGGSPSAGMWDASTGRRLRILPQEGDVFAAVFSPDGTRILVTGNGEASIIDAGSGKTLLRLPNPGGDLQPDGAWSPDGKVVALALGTGAGAVTAWDSRTGRLVRTFPFPPDGVFALAFSPDGSRLVAGGGGTTGKLWDFASGRVLATLSGHQDTLSNVSFSPDGKWLATTSFDGTVKLWDGRTGRALATVQGTSSGALWDVAFSNDGEHFATADDDGTVKVWDTSTGMELLRLGGATRAVQSVAFSPDGTRLAAGSADGTVRIYILPLNQLVSMARSRLMRSWTPAECSEFLHVDLCPPAP